MLSRFSRKFLAVVVKALTRLFAKKNIVLRLTLIGTTHLHS